MAAHERLITKTSICSQTLLQKLAAVLPKDFNFRIYHLSTPPTKTSALYSAPPDSRPDRTYCESHFLTASIITPVKDNGSESKDVLVFAIEVLIYSTAYDTTFFVSKADSTGYLHLLGLPKGTPSPLREISATFLRHLIEYHQRPNIRSIVSLFARAQDQYLFPGSIEYRGKHVLDDRGLVRWWCRVLDPLIENSKIVVHDSSQWDSVKGYLIVPGLDTHETLSYIPKKQSAINTNWIIGHPLKEISRHPDNVPPRCLIPHYPDDPKARFLDELDDEISKGKNGSNGQWKSAKCIDQFWEMMAFRQECSAGRLVGFIWIVFTPKMHEDPSESFLGDSQSTAMSVNDQLDSSFRSIPITPTSSFNASSQPQPTTSPFKPHNEAPSASQKSIRSPKRWMSKKNKKLSGPIVARQPRIKTQNKNYLLEEPESTAYYVWAREGRGQVVVEELDYKRVTELLLRLDFSNLELATSSSSRWVNEVRSGAWGEMSEAWGQTVTGTRVMEVKYQAGAAGVNTLNMGLVRKKRKGGTEELKETTTPPATNGSAPAVTILSAGMVRKKAKV
jgi:regulator of Ty1 transposition protein 109